MESLRTEQERGRDAARRFLALLGMTGSGDCGPSPGHPERSEGSARLCRAIVANKAPKLLAVILPNLVFGLALVVATSNGFEAAAQDATSTSDSLNQAGLVIRHGDGRVTYALVEFSEEKINGIELLRRSGVEQVTIPFGGLGEGVCMLEGEGCPATECRRRVCQAPGTDSPYWRSFGLDETGAWSPFALGSSATAVHDGDVHLWAWTPADPGLAPVTLAEVARLAGANGQGGNNDHPAVFVRTVYPAGFAPPDEDDGVDPLAYAAAGGVLIAIGCGALYAARRGQRPDRSPDRDTWEAA